MNPLNATTLAPLRGQLERVRDRWHGSPAQRLWRAWLSELHGLLPARWRARLGAGPQLQLLDWPLSEQPVAGVAGTDDSGSLAAAAHVGNLAQPAPNAAPRQVLMLPASAVMIQQLSVPLLATRNLHTVLGFELDKHTPFNAAQLYFDTRLLSRDKRQARVLLVAILRERLQAILDHCQQQGLSLQAVDVRDDQGQPLRIDLLPRTARPGGRGGNRLKPILWSCCAALVLGSMLLWLDTRQTLLDDMHASVSEQRQQVDQLQRLRSELLNSRGAARYLAQRKAAQPTLSLVLADLTDCLGADTWLEQLEVSDSGEVTLSGQSARASDLIGRVKNCHSLVDAQFQGIIQPDNDTGKERFSLRARLHKEVADASSPERP